MQTKTYFASSVPAALDLARKELGNEAMLLNSRPAPAESRAFGRLEVTFAYEDREQEAPVAPRPQARTFRPAFRMHTAERRETPAVPVAGPSSDMDDLRRQVEALREALGQRTTSERRPEPVAPISEAAPRWGGHRQFAARRANDPDLVAARLIQNGISPEVARDLAAVALDSNLEAEISRRITPTVPADWSSGATRMMAFVGPSGRGKTTSLVKIALKFGISGGTPVRIYQAGMHGVGCQEQMARYAAILGVPFFACESVESLNLTLSGDGWRGLILIDTPGVSPADTAGLQALSPLFLRHPQIERHLVLRADSRSADMSYVISRYSILGPNHLLFTGAEEALTTGAMVEVLMETGLECRFLGTGQRIPDDIEETDLPQLIRSVCASPMAAAVGV